MGRTRPIPPERQQQFDVIELAKKKALAWAQEQDIPLHRVEFVVPFVADDFSLEVWLFYETNKQVRRLTKDGTTIRVQKKFLEMLSSDGYPPAWLDQVSFVIDSHQTVERHYGGSYFGRLR